MIKTWKQGEELFSQKCKEKGWRVTDVSENPEYWDKDIDFLLLNPENEHQITVEVKWDTRINSTGNLYLETYAKYSKRHEGWFNFCEADWLAYGDAQTDTFYMFPLKKLHEAIDSGCHYRYANCGDSSEGILLNIKEVEAHLMTL